MMYLTESNNKFKCTHCYSPVTRRLGLFQAKDEYECYAESYVKCFWGMCEKQKSVENFVNKSNGMVITTQPLKQDDYVMPCITERYLVATKVN